MKADVVIIGAGAAGLFCASRLGQMGQSVLVLDHANKVGKKILMSGGGFCNFTNLDVQPQHYVSQNPQFVRSALSRFLPEDFLALVDKHHIAYQTKAHGQLFCQQGACDIVTMLLAECQESVYYGGQVDIRLNSTIMQVQKTEGGFLVMTCPHKKKQANLSQNQDCQYIYAPKLVIATGGLSIPTMGASALGYRIAEQFGHRLIETRPSLVPLTFTDTAGDLMKAHAGVSLEVIVSNTKKSFALPMLLTHRGLSGPAILQLSNYWQVGEIITINLVPKEDVGQWLMAQKRNTPKQHIRTALAPFFAKKLLADFENYFWADIKDKPLTDIADKALMALGRTLNGWQVKPSGTEGYRVAEVTLGGIDTQEISSKTMQSRLVPNLYFIGEVLDVTGHLGGYNFQWAWASAHACAMGIVSN